MNAWTQGDPSWFRRDVGDGMWSWTRANKHATLGVGASWPSARAAMSAADQRLVELYGAAS